MEEILPQENPYLCGHEDQQQMLLNAWKSGKLHNSWLISGPQGVGKATLAYRFARFLLSAREDQKESYVSLDVGPQTPAFKLIAQNAHPNLKIFEKDFIKTDKEKIIKAIKDGDPLGEDELKKLKKSNVIKVDEVRTINEFLSKKSFDGDWRVVIIDSIDDLNTASANAILKILEEPPAKSILLLISHQPNKLLPTIRSRCAKLNLEPLELFQTESLLRRYAPELSEAEVKGIAAISSGSIGKALKYAQGNGLSLYRTMENLFFARASFDVSKAVEFAEEVSKNEDVWSLTQELIFKFLSDMIKSGTCVEALYSAMEKIQHMYLETTALNMDKKLAMINMIRIVCEALSEEA